MDELSKWAGFDIHWTGEVTPAFGDDLIIDETLPHPLGRLRNVALDPSACASKDRFQYWLYNEVARLHERDSALRVGADVFPCYRHRAGQNTEAFSPIP